MCSYAESVYFPLSLMPCQGRLGKKPHIYIYICTYLTVEDTAIMTAKQKQLTMSHQQSGNREE